MLHKVTLYSETSFCVLQGLCAGYQWGNLGVMGRTPVGDGPVSIVIVGHSVPLSHERRPVFWESYIFYCFLPLLCSTGPAY